MIGTGHSFTAISAPRDAMLRPQGMQGIISVDRDAMTVTAYAGTRLAVLNAELERLGLSLHNMGDIAEQTLAGATSTGTHGTGGVAAGVSPPPPRPPPVARTRDGRGPAPGHKHQRLQTPPGRPRP